MVEYPDRYSVLTKGPPNGPLTQGVNHTSFLGKFLAACGAFIRGYAVGQRAGPASREERFDENGAHDH